MEKSGIKKHHFWILLGLGFLLIALTLSGDVFGVGPAAADKYKKIQDDLKALTSQQVKSDDYREKLEEQKAEIQKQKARVWESASSAQKGLLHWPAALSHLDKLYFGDPVDAQDRAAFMRREVYAAEYDQLPEIIYPTTFP
ncbi:MAG TPA: hypothetical protein VH120_09440, partial [Gemmataceae bacterium]|nr:hypothetical protein [Gemmataceae bacterium]